MSLSAPSPAAAGAPAVRRSPRPAGPRLRVVAPPPRTRRRLPFAAVCAGLLALSLVGLLLLNISLSHGAYEVDGLQGQATRLAEAEQALTEQLAAEAAPARLSERATGLGMVASTNPAFIRLSDGAVLGAPQAAQAPPAPTVATPDPVDPSAPAVTDVTPNAGELPEPVGVEAPVAD